MKPGPAPLPETNSVMSGKICPYCNSETSYVDSIVVYRKSYGMIYYCAPCKAWVGVHKGTDRALGRLANAQLRELKKEAHRWFDPISQEGLIHKFQKEVLPGMNARTRAYYWLSKEMNLPMARCHIGMFNEDECKQVIAICQPIVERLDGRGDIW